MGVEFHNYTIKVKAVMDDKINAVIEECAGEVEDQTKRNSRVDTSKTKNSFEHYTDTATHTSYIGSNYQNAIWEEFGTGEHALKGDGRKGGWFYVDEKGKGHFTHGKKPSRAFWHAYTMLKNAIIKHIQDELKGL